MRAWPALLLVLGLAGPAAADEAGRAAARAVIAKQEQALGRDDAQTAYEQAAPAIRELFPNADLFIGMVRNQYRPVYRHRSFVFGEARDTEGRPWSSRWRSRTSTASTGPPSTASPGTRTGSGGSPAAA